MIQSRDQWIYADFNGIHGDVLCISHDETGRAVSGEEIPLREGMIATVAEPDANVVGEPDWLVATGVVERSPDWLQCTGSKWVLRFDEDGVYHHSEKADRVSGARHAKDALQRVETVQVRPRGHSMNGKVNSGDLVTLEPCDAGRLREGAIYGIATKVEG